jgi:hypothetical protein
MLVGRVSRRVFTAGSLTASGLLAGWLLLRRVLPRQRSKKIYTSPSLVSLDPTATANRLCEAAAKGDTKAQSMLAHATAQTFDS